MKIMKVQLKPGEAVKFGGRRVVGTHDNPAILFGDEVHLRPLVIQGLGDEVMAEPPPPPAPAPTPTPTPSTPETDAKSTPAPPPAPNATQSLNTETTPPAPASTKRKK